MPYVTEQLKFNLRSGNNGPQRERPVTSQPPLVTFDGSENKFDFSNKMEHMAVLARRDIRLGRVSSQSDLDFIPVKEVREQRSPVKSAPPSKPVTRPGAFKPGKCLIQIPTSNNKRRGHHHSTPVSHRAATSPTKQPGSPQTDFSAMIDTLNHSIRELSKPVNTYYNDTIEEDRLQRRVEEQRRHLYRMFYNTKRQVTQLVELLERTPFNHRTMVMAQTSTMSHLNTAYRSLMSGLGAFTRVSHTLNSKYMTQLKKKVRTEIRGLVDEIVKICRLLDIQINVLTSAPSSPVPRLNITENLGEASEQLGGGAPNSPERDESLKAAVRSLVQTKVDLGVLPPPPKGSPPPKSSRQRSIAMNKKAPPKVSQTKKVIKPKVSRYPGKRPVSAKVGRPLGQVAARPLSAPARDPIEVHGGYVTPLITEKELPRDTWMQRLHHGRAAPKFAWTEHQSTPRSDPPPSPAAMSTTMNQLLDELKELEREDDVMRNKWFHGQVHDSSEKSIVLPSANLFLSSNPGVGSDQLNLTYQRAVSDVTLTEEAVDNITAYKASMEQYLRLTKHYQTEKFNPWATLDHIVGEIVDGVVGEVLGELGGCCDGIANTLYLSEFVESK